MSKRSLLLCISVVCLLSPCAWPQPSTATVDGMVRDQAGAVVPNTAATLLAVSTNGVSSGKTNETGFYMFPCLVPGPYRLTAESRGMQKYEATLTDHTMEFSPRLCRA